MENSIFLAQLIGPTIFLFGLFILLNPERTKRVGREILNSEALLMISGAITVPAGLAIVITHNIWVANWSVIITIFGWIAVFAGASRLLLPNFLKSVGDEMQDKTSLIAFPAVLMTLLGIFLSYQGYFA